MDRIKGTYPELIDLRCGVEQPIVESNEANPSEHLSGSRYCRRLACPDSANNLGSGQSTRYMYRAMSEESLQIARLRLPYHQFHKS